MLVMSLPLDCIFLRSRRLEPCAPRSSILIGLLAKMLPDSCTSATGVTTRKAGLLDFSILSSSFTGVSRPLMIFSGLGYRFVRTWNSSCNLCAAWHSFVTAGGALVAMFIPFSESTTVYSLLLVTALPTSVLLMTLAHLILLFVPKLTLELPIGQVCPTERNLVQGPRSSDVRFVRMAFLGSTRLDVAASTLKISGGPDRLGRLLGCPLSQLFVFLIA